MVVAGVGLGWELGAHQCPTQLEPGGLIIPCGSVLLQVVEPDRMVCSDHGPPEVGKTVIGQRIARDHPLSGRRLRDGTVAVCLSLQMTAN